MHRLTIVFTLSAAAFAQQPARTCESLTSLSQPNTTIESAAVQEAAGNTPAFCRVTAVTTHPPAGDRVKIWIGLPLTGWNGRFEGLGGVDSPGAALLA